MNEVNNILQASSATLVAFTILALLISLRQGKHLWAGIGFAFSVLCYLIRETQIVQDSFLVMLVVTGSICAPFFFWLLSKSIFDDHFKFTSVLMGWLLLQIASHTHYYLSCIIDLSPSIEIGFTILAQLVSLGFVFGAIYVALKTKQTDLIEPRLRFRGQFIITTALLIGITLIVETAPDNLIIEYKDPLQSMQRLTILALTGYFLLSNFGFLPGFFFREIQKPKQAIPIDVALEKQLMNLITGKKIYRTEGLTIKELAETMGVQEHRLRKLINGQLGFRNFNDFLNQYRVQEASEILSDPNQNQKTILEIAYYLGYQSIGPFNKAFKELKNTTPTVFRKQSQA